MSLQPTYILSPNFHFKPGTGPIGLGNIISHPLRPHRALTNVDAATLEKIYPRVERFTSYERSISRGTQSDISISLWAEFLQTVSAKVSGGSGSDVQSNYTMESLETIYFVADPSLEEIQARLNTPRVQAVTKASRVPGFRAPVYMVTGLMIAKGFTVDMQNNSHRNGEIELSGNAPLPASEVGVGANLANSTSVGGADKWRASEDIVFAYQLLKIEVKGWRGDRVEYDELRHKAAYLSTSDGDDTDEEEDGIEDFHVSPVHVGNLQGDHKAEEMTVREVGEEKIRVSCIYSVQK